MRYKIEEIKKVLVNSILSGETKEASEPIDGILFGVMVGGNCIKITHSEFTGKNALYFPVYGKWFKAIVDSSKITKDDTMAEKFGDKITEVRYTPYRTTIEFKDGSTTKL